MNSTPRTPGSTRKRVGRTSSPSIALAMTIITRAASAEVTNHFSPSITQPPSLRVAVVAIFEGSEPACSSVTA